MRLIVNPYRFAAVGGGAWQDVIAQGSTDSDNGANSSINIACKITAGSTGNCTKLRIYVGTGFVSSTDVKMALYTEDGATALSWGTGTVTAGNGYTEVNITSQAVTSGTVYYIVFQPASGNAGNWRYKGGFTSGDTRYGGVSYASFPVVPLDAASNLDWHLAVGMWIE